MRSRRLVTKQASHHKVDLFCLNGFESYNKFTRGKWLKYAVSGVASNITHCPIGQCHDVTCGIFFCRFKNVSRKTFHLE